jgi:flagellar biosynthetic protein FliQ
MNQDLILDISKNALVTISLVSAPTLLTGLIVGIVVSLIQTMTQINEATLSFIPKLIAVGLVLMFTGHWMLSTLMQYTVTLIQNIPHFIGVG